MLMKHRMPQLSRGDGSSRALNSSAFALMVYGLCVFVFWCVFYARSMPCINTVYSLSFNIYQIVNGKGPVH